MVYVRARSVRASESPFEVFPRQQREQSTGSGFVLDEKGYILTNAHVVDGAPEVRVHVLRPADGRGAVVGKDTYTDLAVLR